MTVGDSVVGRQWFSDSVMTIINKPVVELGRFYLDTILTCTYPEGPFMWYFNGTLMPHRTTFGMNGDSLIFKPKPGRYKVVARSPFGCDVESNEVTVIATGVDESDGGDDARYWAYPSNDGSVYIRWDGTTQSPLSIAMFDIVGRQLNIATKITTNEAIVSHDYGQGPVFVVIFAKSGMRVLQVLCP